MKYIRTKDGRIIELPKQPTLMKYENVIIDLNEIRKGKVGHEIINALIDKQADTIEELCDEFIIAKPNEKPFKILYPLRDFQQKSSIEFQKKCGYKIFGAIWTDKGLIYIAKMNDKGELELL